MRLLASVLFALSLKQGIALELRFHISGEFEIGELQEFDRLLKLRRHYQGLPLPQFKLWCERHMFRLENLIERRESRSYPNLTMVRKPCISSKARSFLVSRVAKG